jgi:hypothetical protein
MTDGMTYEDEVEARYIADVRRDVSRAFRTGCWKNRFGTIEAYIMEVHIDCIGPAMSELRIQRKIAERAAH